MYNGRVNSGQTLKGLSCKVFERGFKILGLILYDFVNSKSCCCQWLVNLQKKVPSSVKNQLLSSSVWPSSLLAFCGTLTQQHELPPAVFRKCGHPLLLSSRDHQRMLRNRSQKQNVFLTLQSAISYDNLELFPDHSELKELKSYGSFAQLCLDGRYKIWINDRNYFIDWHSK